MESSKKVRYEKGKLILEEAPPVEVAEVLVTFTQIPADSKTPHFGYGKGTFGKLPVDFNGPLKDYM